MRSFAYPKTARLLRRTQIAPVLRDGDVFACRQCLVRRRANEEGRARLGLSAPRRYGNAIRRNRFRRLVREAFRVEQEGLGAFDYLVSPRKHLGEPTLDGIRKDLCSTRTREPLPKRAPRGPQRKRR